MGTVPNYFHQPTLFERIRNRIVRCLCPQSVEALFHNPSERLFVRRRIKHLHSLALPFNGNSLLEVGSGVGDFYPYYLSQVAEVTISDGRKVLVEKMKHRFSSARVLHLNLDPPPQDFEEQFDIISCYGLLYHVSNPTPTLEFLSKICRKFLILETRINPDNPLSVRFFDESTNYHNATSGNACLPGREWVFKELQKFFPHVYVPLYLPNNNNYTINWSKKPCWNARTLFIAAKSKLDNPLLLDYLPLEQRWIT